MTLARETEQLHVLGIRALLTAMPRLTMLVHREALVSKATAHYENKPLNG
jgi:hypothetical protein